MNINTLSNHAISSMEYRKNTKITKEESECTETTEIKNSTQCYQDLCKRYPNAAFIVISDKVGTIDESYSRLGACDLSHFGYPDQLSFMIPEQVLEKMANNPEHANKVYSQINSLIHNYETITHDVMDAKTVSVCIRMEDIDEVDRYHLPFMTIAAESTMDACINSGKQNTDFLQEKLRKISYLNEIKYNEMLDQFFERRQEKRRKML